MIITTAMLLFFIAVSVAIVAIGMFFEKQEVYFLGVLLLFFTGLMVLQTGFVERMGEISHEENGTTTTIYSYESVSNTWNNGIALLCIVFAAGLSLHFYTAKKQREEKERDSLEVPE